MNPTESGMPAWGPPTGPDLGLQQAQQQNGCSLFQSPLFWLIAAGIVIYLITQNEQKESEID